MPHRCDYCRGPCGYPDNPCIITTWRGSVCIHCYFDPDEIEDFSDFLSWQSSDSEPDLDDDDSEEDDIPNDEGQPQTEAHEPEAEPEPEAETEPEEGPPQKAARID